MDIIGLESVIYGADNIKEAIKFQQDWGLELVEKGNSGAKFKLPDNTTVQIFGSSDSILPPASVPGSTAREVIWGVQEKNTLKLIGAELSKDREVTVDVEGGLHSFDDLGYRIGFKITSREIKPLIFPNCNTVGNGSRINKRADVFFTKKSNSKAHVSRGLLGSRRYTKIRKFLSG